MEKTLHTLKLGFTHCYLLPCRGGYLLIDTSYPQEYAHFEGALARLGIDPSDIRYLLLTHHHDDHAGFAAPLVARTGCRVIAHEKAVEPLRNGASAETMQPLNLRVKLVFGIFRRFHGTFTFTPLTLGKDDILLTGDDPDLLKEIGIEGEILHTPGHSSDSISVLLSDGRAFVGDVAMNFLRFTGIRHRPIYIEAMDAVFESWQKLKDHGATMIYPAHGAPFPASRLRETR